MAAATMTAAAETVRATPSRSTIASPIERERNIAELKATRATAASVAPPVRSREISRADQSVTIPSISNAATAIAPIDTVMAGVLRRLDSERSVGLPSSRESFSGPDGGSVAEAETASVSKHTLTTTRCARTVTSSARAIAPDPMPASTPRL